MKKLNFITLAIIGIYACLNFSSCKKDDDKEEVVTLIGTWYEQDGWYLIFDSKFYYFCETSSVNSWEEKYEYEYDPSTKKITDISGVTKSGEEITSLGVIYVKKLTATEIWLKEGDLEEGDIRTIKRVK